MYKYGVGSRTSIKRTEPKTSQWHVKSDRYAPPVGDLNGDGVVGTHPTTNINDWDFFTNALGLEMQNSPQYQDYGPPNFSSTCE